MEFANKLAACAGLTNVRFVESSFADLDTMSDAELPDFDVIVSHGVVSWISPANRSHLVGMIAKRLKPGGLVYLSYNVMTGWAAMVPVQALMQMLATASPERSDAALPGVLDFINRLKEAGALYFQAHPTLENLLPAIRKLDPIYAAHEYLNQQWRPLMFADFAAEMLKARCHFIGSATLIENIASATVPQNVVPILAETRDLNLRETLRDLGCAQSFRRDLYRKGIAPMTEAARQGLLEGLMIAAVGQPMPEGDVTFTTPIGSVTGMPELYGPLLSMLETGPVSLGQAHKSFAHADRPLADLIEAFTLLVSGGYAHPMLPEGATEAGRAMSRRLNLAIAQANADVASLRWIAAPAIGSAVPVDPLETLLLGELLAGKPLEVASLARELVRLISRSGQSLQRAGELVTDPAQMMRAVTELVVGMLEKRVPVLQQLGVMEG